MCRLFKSSTVCFVLMNHYLSCHFLTLLRQDTHFGYYRNSADPLQMLSFTGSDQGLHCLLTGISMENAVKVNTCTRPLVKKEKGLNGKTHFVICTDQGSVVQN